LDFNLKMLNLWIGLCKGDHGLPAEVHSLGFRNHSIEQRIYLGEDGVCVPELIVYSKKLSHTLAFEWKSGRNTEDDQLQRYAKLTAKHLVNVGMVPKDAAATMDVVLVCAAQHFGTIKIGLEKRGISFPVISVDEGGLSLAMNSFQCSQLNQIFTPGLQIDFAVAPTSHVPLSEKSEDWEVAEIVIPVILQKMLDRQTLIRASTICTAICPLWDNMQATARKSFQAKVCSVLEQAALGEFGSFLQWRRMNNDCAVDFVHNPVEEHGRKRSGAMTRLNNASREFKLRLIAGRKFERESSLFDDIEPQ